MTISTADLVSNWVMDTQKEETRKQVWELSKLRLASSINLLGERMAPDDMTVGESIACWVRLTNKHERLLVVVKKPDNNYDCYWRGKPRDEL